MTVDYPEERAGEFPPPPRTVTDQAGREIRFRRGTEADRDPLVRMYLAFDPADRAQGIPPCREQGIRDWLDAVAVRECRTVVALHDDDHIGHGMLVADDEDGYELALFVLQAYQGAGIGTDLLRTLLGLGQATGVERVWLTVERWNEPAIAVYRKVGFQRVDDANFELVMALAL